MKVLMTRRTSGMLAVVRRTADPGRPASLGPFSTRRRQQIRKSRREPRSRFEKEIARKHTLSASLAYAEWKQTKINSSTSPGMANFIARRARPHYASPTPRCRGSTRCSGVQVQTRESLAGGRRDGTSRFRVVNRRSRAREPGGSTLVSVRGALNRTVIPYNCHRAEKIVPRRLDLVAQKAYTLPDDGSGKLHESGCRPTWPPTSSAREALIEMVAEADEALMESLEVGRHPGAIVSGLRTATSVGKSVPLSVPLRR